MANTSIQLRKSGVTGNAPAVLEHGEVAINYADGRLYYRTDTNDIDYIYNQETFSTISSNGNLILATSPTDILSFIPGSAISIVANTTNKTLTFGVDESQVGSFVRKTGDIMTGTLSAPTANVISKNLIFYDTLYTELGTRYGTPLPNLISQFTSNSHSYVQVNAENIDPHGTADFVITGDVGNDTEFYIDFGYINSQYDNQSPINSLGDCAFPLDGYLYVQGSTIDQQGGNLVIGTTSSHYPTNVKLLVGGVNYENVVTVFSATDTLIRNELKINKSLTVNSISNLQTTSITIPSDVPTVIDTVNSSIYRSAKYFVQMSNGSSHHIIELNVLHDNSSAFISQYGEIISDVPLGTFSATLTGGNIELTFDSFYSSTNVKFTRTAIVV